MTDINPQRLMETLQTARSFGQAGTGVDRPAFSPADMAAREWLKDRMRDSGLAPEMDRFGTLLGRTGRRSEVVLIGSHSDSVPRGGWLDGTMGVVYGLEIARSRAEALGPDRAGVDVVSFQDEEGAFVPCLGSRAFVGEIEDERAFANATSIDGRRLVDMLTANGLSGLPIHRLERDRYLAYLEGHIEQGPRLEAAGIGVGIVTAIVGIRRYRIAIEGRADHAGTTPLSMRRDAGAAALHLGARILDRFASAAGPDAVWNIGQFTLRPGAANVVPSGAEMSVEIREVSEAGLDRMEAMLRDCVSATGLPTELSPTVAIPPTAMTDSIADTLQQASQALAVASMRMPSGAGHDAMIIGRHLPTGMLFVPSIDGRSHDTVEDTSVDDIVTGCRVLASAVATLLGS